MSRLTPIGSTPVAVSTSDTPVNGTTKPVASPSAGKTDLATRTQKGAGSSVRNTLPSNDAQAATVAAPKLSVVLQQFEASQAAKGVSPSIVRSQIGILNDMKEALGPDHAGLLGDRAASDALFHTYQSGIRAMFPGEAAPMVEFAEHALDDLRSFAKPTGAV